MLKKTSLLLDFHNTTPAKAPHYQVGVSFLNKKTLEQIFSNMTLSHIITHITLLI